MIDLSVVFMNTVLISGFQCLFLKLVCIACVVLQSLVPLILFPSGVIIFFEFIYKFA